LLLNQNKDNKNFAFPEASGSWNEIKWDVPREMEVEKDEKIKKKTFAEIIDSLI
jgi:hypothetical protein